MGPPSGRELSMGRKGRVRLNSGGERFGDPGRVNYRSDPRRHLGLNTELGHCVGDWGLKTL